MSKVSRTPPSALELACAALAGGQSADPFAILGPHRVGEGLLVIRAVQPAARDVEVLLGGAAYPMQPRPEPGLFEATLPLAPGAEVPDYRLRIAFASGVSHTVDDPYRYGPVFSPCTSSAKGT